MRVDKFRTLAICASTFALIAGSNQAFAQVTTTTEAIDEVPATGLNEIVVTAQRREERLQDVPLSVQAFGEKEISRKVILDTRDLATTAPTVNFTGGAPFNTAFSLRGISSIALETGIQSSTALLIDGVPVVRQSEFNSKLGDLQRIEVLNGPQGTLFGKNSTAGVINITTKDPTYEFEGLVEAIATTDEEVMLRGVINAPLTDSVRLRVTAFYNNLEPLIDNLTADDAYYQRAYGVRGKLAVDLNDNATFMVTAGYSNTKGGFGQNVRLGPSIYNDFTESITGLPSVRGLTTINTNTSPREFNKSWYVTGTLNWELSDNWDLVSITNYTDYNSDAIQDIDLSPAGANIGIGETIPDSGYPFQYLRNFDGAVPDKFHYYSQEVRLNYTTDTTSIVFGGYYQKFIDNFHIDLPVYLDGFLIGAPGTGPYYVTDAATSRIEDTTMSLFGDVTQSISDTFSVFAGLRYTNEKNEVDYHRESYFGLYSDYDPVTGVFNGDPVAVYDVSSKDTINNLSGRVGVKFEPNRDMNFYASYARGYKGPAVNVGRSLAVGTDPILKPEIADAFEVGAKLRLFGTVALNVAAFYEEIKDIQVSVTEPGNSVTTVLTNAGKIKTRGVEGDFQWAVTPEFRLSAAGAYVKATYEGFNYLCNSVQLATDTCPDDPTSGQQDISGQQAIGSPKWKYSITADYEREIGDLTGFAQIDYIWNSSIQYQLGDDPITREPSKGLLNASLGIRGPDDAWEVQVFGKNLTNKFYYNSLFSVPIDGLPIGFLPRDFHRYVGVKLLTRF